MWKMIAAPLVGAVIGYLTNWIAVKMLFHPRHEKKIGKWKVPFTPGVIPKGQPRLAKAIGIAVEEQLLTAEVMKKILFSDDCRERVKDTLHQWHEEKKKTNQSIREMSLNCMDEESFQELKLFFAEEGADLMMDRLLAMNPGKLLTERMMEAAKEKLADSMFGMMLSGGFMDGIAQMLEQELNRYLEENGSSYISTMIHKELCELEDKTSGDILLLMEKNGIDLESTLLALYERVVEDYLEKMLSFLNLSGIVEERINSMKVEELEELVLSIMKRELGTIVNLGAIIGFILGLFNVLIMLV